MPELADIFRDRHEDLNGFLNGEQLHAVRDIIACRSPEMGRGALYCCPDCGTEHFIWRSCGNRNCPKCGNDKVTRWLAKRQTELLPVDYYLVTHCQANFTPFASAIRAKYTMHFSGHRPRRSKK